MKWEYRVESYAMTPVPPITLTERLERYLGNDGKQGWELVSAFVRSDSLLFCVLKRKLKANVR